MNSPSVSHTRHRFPPRIISHVVWLYVRFNLSLRKVEEMLLQRGIGVANETVRSWVIKFGPRIARTLRQRRRRPGDARYLDEVIVKISGRKYWLWRAVDQPGVVPDEILQSKWDKQAAKWLLRSLIKRLGFTPKGIITDKLCSYGAAKREIAPGLDHWAHKGLTNRVGNSRLSFRKREQTMQGYRSPGGLQRFVTTYSAIRNCFRVLARRRSA